MVISSRFSFWGRILDLLLLLEIFVVVILMLEGELPRGFVYWANDRRVT